MAKKTGQRRTVPVTDRLQDLLLDSFEVAQEGEDLVLPGRLVSGNNLRRNFHVIIRRTGLDPWPDCFQVLRHNCATDWAAKVPAFVSAAWLGHCADRRREQLALG